MVVSQNEESLLLPSRCRLCSPWRRLGSEASETVHGGGSILGMGRGQGEGVQRWPGVSVEREGIASGNACA